ncbi:FKBP-type peptidyl-prolyl cis-trans isomerase [Desulfonatronovibrio magnus]|uniref:FKBP-type peptidyl-prolyl cis-trans isomerase n=1 Tax=Desulfonatronovibrio magnus TaxID=698827 RepID=UPI0005EB79FE|nr:FKBP-type peptidyl-prolyl cis-trans isomerase [Desulfonatronovibrio magnus]
MKLLKSAFLAGLCLFLFACDQSSPEPQAGQQQEAPITLETSKDKASYALGLDIGNNIAQGEMDIDTRILVRGLQDALEDRQPLMTEEEQFEALMALQQEFMQAQQEKAQQQAQHNLDLGATFMDDYRDQDDVMETDSGILYRILTEGDGERPAATDIVTVHYTGRTVDGTVFDSSVERGEPATFPLNQVISGWTEILQLMPEGSKWEVVIPPDLAYGDQQAGPVIGPGSTLIFEIELFEIQSPE